MPTLLMVLGYGTGWPSEVYGPEAAERSKRADEKAARAV
jgi:hypothetical protein